MAATKEDIQRWIEEAKEENATHMIVVCDTYDYDDYPVNVLPGDDLKEKVAEYNGKNMQKIMEVYDLSADIDEQLNSYRVGTHLF